MIGPDIVVEVLAVHGNQVRIAVQAPREVRVDREEVRQKIIAEQEAACQRHAQ